MKRLLGAGCLLAVLAGTALAQSTPPTSPPLPAPAVADVQPSPPPPAGPAMAGQDATDDDDAGSPPPHPKGKRPPPDADAGPGGPPPHGKRPPPPSRAARFMIERGDLAVDIKCADDEPMRVCADATLQVLDKLNGMQSR